MNHTKMIAANGQVIEFADGTEDIRPIDELLEIPYSEMNEWEIEAIITYKAEQKANEILTEEHRQMFRDEKQANREAAFTKSEQALKDFYALVNKSIEGYKAVNDGQAKSE